MDVDSEFVNEIADLHESWMNSQKSEEAEDLLDIPSPEEIEKAFDHPNYLKMEKKLQSLNPEEWNEFLAIYYLGRGNYPDINTAREEVPKLGPHDIHKILGKGNLSYYLRKADAQL